MNSILLWKDILFSPYEGFRKVKPDTKILFPLLALIILIAAGTALLMPVMQSRAYGDAIIRSQINSMTEKGQEMSTEQQEAMIEQMSSPMVRNITIASAFGGGIVTSIVIMLLSSLLIKIVSKAFKAKLTFSHVFKILVFAGIITIIQALIKNGITLAGNYERILNQVQSTDGLKYALTSSISLAALFSPETLGSVGYFLVDTFTDIFNWLYFIFVFAGLKSSGGLNKNQAMGVILIYAGCFILVGIIMTLII